MNKEYDVVVIGGGPAGSTISTLLSKKGRKVLLIEKELFPRYHIGESLVTGVIPILEELGALDKMKEEDFVKKFGITLVWGEQSKPWTVMFQEAVPNGDEKYKYAYQVDRAKFDHILLDHAQTNGVEVLQEHRVTDFIFEGERCVGLTYKDKFNEQHEVRAKFVVDASGQNALIGKQKNLLKYDEGLKNLAVWTYFKNGKRYEGELSGNIITEHSHKGWMWYIPLKDNITSVGWVAPANVINRKELATQYFDILNGTKEIKKMLSNAEQVEEFKTIKDWSYRCDKFSGPGYLMTGDAAGFVDPLFSTGVFLAMNAASYGSRVIDKILSNPIKEQELLEEYEMKYKKFLDVVLSFVHYFYDSNRKRQDYFEKAKELVDPVEEMTARRDFVYLISGLAGSHLIEDIDLDMALSE